MELPYLLKEFNIHILQLPFILAKLRREIKKRYYEVKPFDRMPVLLHELYDEGFEMGIVSSNYVKTIKSFLSKYDMEYFKYVYADKHIFTKKNLLNKAIKEHKLDRDNVIYIGDELRDIEAAVSAGVKICSVSWGFNSVEVLSKYNKDSLANTPEELKYKLHTL